MSVTHFTGLSASENLTVGGNAAVTGLSVSENLTVGGNAAVTGLSVSENLTVGGNAAVTGNATVTGNVAVTGNTTMTGNLSVSGSITGTLPAHNHAASAVNSGVLAHERGGLEADVSAWSGIPLIEGGVTRQVKLGGDEGLHLKGFGKAFYAFADDGGAVGSIDTGIVIPAGAVITKAWYSVLDAPASAGEATIALGYTGKVGAFKAATDFDDASMAEGLHDAIQDGTVANFEAIGDTAVNVLLTIAVADLTAGEIDIIFEYYID